MESVDYTRLTITGYTDTNGTRMIEILERSDKDIAIGFQFHPEAAVVKHLEHAENEYDFMDYDTAIRPFIWLIEQVSIPLADAA